MSDIFISYARQDAAEARHLAEMLTRAGLSVWIDHAGIDPATSWSKEIVQAINECKAFVLLLSSSSIASRNVLKEVSLASEKGKKIIPLDLEPVDLTEDFEYQLAGIQRALASNIDAVIRVLNKLGLEAAQAPVMAGVRSADSRQSMMILPFEDLSPTGDNGWFADGLASEMIAKLSNIKSLRILDWNTSQLFRSRKTKTVEIAREFAVRYFIEGQVRKFGDQIKITMTLLDIATGDHLWQDSLKGTMEDIFDIQEQCAEKVVSGLELHLTQAEEVNVKRHQTTSAEAYELYLKARDYFSRRTRADLEHALALYEHAVQLDPGFTAAYANIVSTCQAIYRAYTRNESLIERAETAAGKVQQLAGASGVSYWVQSMNAFGRGDDHEAFRLANLAVEADPELRMAYDVIGIAGRSLGRNEEAILALTRSVQLNENSLTTQMSLLNLLHGDGESSEPPARFLLAASTAIPVFERHLRLNPDDMHARVQLLSILAKAGRVSEALLEARRIDVLPNLDGVALYNLGCVFVRCGASGEAIATLRRSIENGFTHVQTFRTDEELDPLRGTPEFEALVEKLEASQHG